MFEETIAAISTPPGEGGISVVRMSGRQALSIADRLFRGKVRPSQSLSHRVLHGRISAPRSGEPIDEVLLVVMRGPKTYTAEDMVEVNCHGGYLVTRGVLEAVLSCGARLAEPGEFTKRAFLNGRIDLAQAEAVLDVVRSRTPAGLRLALEQLGGGLSSAVERVRHQLVEVLSQLEVAVDFSESDIQALSRGQQISSIAEILRSVEGLIQTSDAGKILREGAKMAIVGKPNVGKSSLLNALLKEERAIVSPIPGTTRDTIEEWLNLEGLPLRIVDTAGLGGAADEIEREGGRRAEERMGQADVVLFVVDGSVPLDERDVYIAQRLNGKRHIAVINKIDLKQMMDEDRLPGLVGGPVLKISALRGLGLEALKRSIIDSVLNRPAVASEGIFVTHLRHRDALMRTGAALGRALETLERGLSEEFVAQDVREALVSVGEITGETATEEILEKIFSQFCVGK
ncbi:MAG: tRNA uridine-5-carboxymethylaminomethyl(34) synthesis GTPase MnmE [bacterium]